MSTNANKTLREVFCETHSLGELKILCHELGIDYDVLKGENKPERFVSLIQFCRENGRLSDLQTYLETSRDAVQWAELFENIPDYAEPKRPDVPVQLPFTRPDHFTGRQDELNTLMETLYPGNKIVIVAPGGMGKTAVSAETLYRLQEEGDLLTRFPDGVIFYSFYGRSHNDTLYQHINLAFNPTATEHTFDTAYRHLAGKKLLLIFDGAEEAEDLPRAMQLQGQCGLLITTRDRRTQAETRIELGLLSLDEAKQVLHKWSQNRVADGFAEAICEEVGRFTLALRIAGFYLDSSGEPAADYLSALQETPIRELSHGDHREDSVGILMDRTMAQLDEASKTVLSALGTVAFAPIDQAHFAPLFAPAQTLLRDALNQLHRYGLIQRDGRQI